MISPKRKLSYSVAGVVLAFHCADGFQSIDSIAVEIGNQPGGRIIRFIDEQNGWLNDYSSLWRTQDGGRTWARIAIPRPMEAALNKELTSVVEAHPEGGESGWLQLDIVSSVNQVAERQRMYRTEDGGESWTAGRGSPLETEGLQQVLFYLPPGRVGWEGGSRFNKSADPGKKGTQCKPWWDGRNLIPSIFHTIDGGQEWREQVLPGAEGCTIERLYFQSEKQGLAVAGHFVYFTLDGGMHWRRSEFKKCCSANDWHATRGFPPSAVFFRGTEVGWLSYQDGFLFKTEDCGKSWRELAHPGQIWQKQAGWVDPGALYFESESRGWILGGDRVLYATTDGGSHWSAVSSSEPIISFSCVASNSCWALSELKLYRIQWRK